MGINKRKIDSCFIEIGTCPKCGHFPVQFIELPNNLEPVKLHITRDAKTDCLASETKRLANIIYELNEKAYL